MPFTNGVETVIAPSGKASAPSLVRCSVRLAVVPTWRSPKSASGATERLRPKPASAAVNVGPFVTVVSVACLDPVTVGRKATITVHVSFACSGFAAPRAGHVPLSANCAASGPPSVLEVTDTGSVPVFLTAYVVLTAAST